MIDTLIKNVEDDIFNLYENINILRKNIITLNKSSKDISEKIKEYETYIFNNNSPVNSDDKQDIYNKIAFLRLDKSRNERDVKNEQIKINEITDKIKKKEEFLQILFNKKELNKQLEPSEEIKYQELLKNYNKKNKTSSSSSSSNKTKKLPETNSINKPNIETKTNKTPDIETITIKTPNIKTPNIKTNNFNIIEPISNKKANIKSTKPPSIINDNNSNLFLSTLDKKFNYFDNFNDNLNRNNNIMYNQYREPQLIKNNVKNNTPRRRSSSKKQKNNKIFKNLFGNNDLKKTKQNNTFKTQVDKYKLELKKSINNRFKASIDSIENNKKCNIEIINAILKLYDLLKNILLYLLLATITKNKNKKYYDSILKSMTNEKIKDNKNEIQIIYNLLKENTNIYKNKLKECMIEKYLDDFNNIYQKYIKNYRESFLNDFMEKKIGGSKTRKRFYFYNK